MRVEFLYWDDCPSHEEGLARLREALASAAPTAELAITLVPDDEAAARLRFIGSPTIRVNGVDVDPGARDRTDYSLACRVYQRPDGRFSPLPPREMLLAALKDG